MYSISPFYVFVLSCPVLSCPVLSLYLLLISFFLLTGNITGGFAEGTLRYGRQDSEPFISVEGSETEVTPGGAHNH